MRSRTREAPRKKNAWFRCQNAQSICISYEKSHPLKPRDGAASNGFLHACVRRGAPRARKKRKRPAPLSRRKKGGWVGAHPARPPKRARDQLGAQNMRPASSEMSPTMGGEGRHREGKRSSSRRRQLHAPVEKKKGSRCFARRGEG